MKNQLETKYIILLSSSRNIGKSESDLKYFG